MSKKKPGAKKGKNRPSLRPSAPPLGLVASAVAPSAGVDDDAAPPSSETSPASESPPDTFAPTSTRSRAAAEAGDRAHVLPPEATPAGISVDVVPEHASARKLSIEDEADRAFFEGAAAAEAKLHAEIVKQIQHENAVIYTPVRRVTPEVIARRDRMKRIVTGVVAVAGVLSVAVFARMATAPKQHAFDEAAVKAHAARRVEPVPLSMAKQDAPAARILAPPPPPDDVRDDGDPDDSPKAALAAPSASATTTASVSAVAEASPSPAASAESAAGAPDPEKAKALTKKALQSLEGGRYAAAIEHATAAVDADPTDANAYLYWGTALMETGKRTAAKAVFVKCMANAKRGPKHECASFAH